MLSENLHFKNLLFLPQLYSVIQHKTEYSEYDTKLYQEVRLFLGMVEFITLP